jgi:uncharacterized protein YdhG (YjbR/CyaY superfamily)
MKTRVKNVDEYLLQLPIEQQLALDHVRQTIKKLAPTAEEVISYSMPAYKLHGMLIGFAAFKNHCSLYLWNNTSIKQFEEELKDFTIAAGTIRFTPQKPIPDKLLKKIIITRVKENVAKWK